jgi:hypothetical protein
MYPCNIIMTLDAWIKREARDGRQLSLRICKKEMQAMHITNY